MIRTENGFQLSLFWIRRYRSVLKFLIAIFEFTFLTTRTRRRKTIFKMVLRTTVFVLLCVQSFYGQDHTDCRSGSVNFTKNLCSVDYTKEGCANIVICNFKDKIVRGKTEFTISYRTDSGQDIIADCNWVRSGSFSCDPATGYTCDLQSSGKFLVELSKHQKCIQSGEFVFDFAHEEPFSCKIEPALNLISQDKVNLDNASANANPESQNICLKGRDEKTNGANRNQKSTDKSEDRCKEGDSEQETFTGMIIGVSCTCLLVFVVVVLLVVKRKRLVAFVRKRKRHEGTCVEAPDYIIAVKDFENRECLMPETEDSPIADTLKEKDDVLEALHLRPGINIEVNTNIINTNPTEYDKVCDVRLAHYASSCDGDDRYCGSSSEQT